MTKIRRHATKQRQQEILWGSIALLTAIAIAAAAGYVLLSRPRDIDPKTLCPADGPRGHYVLLVDTTDLPGFTQKLALEVILRDIVEKRIPEGCLVSVFAIGEDVEANAEPLIERCNPGTGEDRSPMTANLKRLRHRYDKQFRDALLEEALPLMARRPSNASPILEMLQMTGVNAFRRHDVQGERRLIVVSDMLHHTPQFSMYRGVLDYSAFADSGYARKVQAELAGVEVEIHYLINKPERQTRRNLAFWEQLFRKAGARIVSVRPVEG